jgi:MoaA/NifB/PqqE/SkfB family radical SAM enzyme
MNTKEAYTLIEKISSIGAKEIVLGGGDPLQRNDILEIAKYAKEHDLIVRLDTNGLLMNDKVLYSISKYIDRIALPLDASTKELHDLLRSYDGHFEVITSLVKKIKNLGIPIKINTIATKVNYKDFINLANLIYNLSDANIYLWSIYQFSPLGRGFKYRKIFNLDDQEFRKLAIYLQNLRLG